MQVRPRGLEKVEALLARGVSIPNPWTLDIDDDVEVSRISADGVTIHPGCRIRGADTVISAGVELGREGPVSIENCRLGPNVSLAGGYANSAVFLDGASLGLGHHVRAGCLLEEGSSGAHTVGLKQTILFPFVTIGSLVNFCDAFMAGGTSRTDHSEVGSSYIHFNFTPSGDKTTPSQFGDVPRGVMLRERPIFLGGQGGVVGPSRVEYGTVVGAGSVLRGDVDEQDHLVMAGVTQSLARPYDPSVISGLPRMLARNIGYLAQLDALEQWYRHGRAPFFATQEFGPLIADGALAMISAARTERTSRLVSLARKLPGAGGVQAEFRSGIDALCEVFGDVRREVDDSVVGYYRQAATSGAAYVDAIRAADDATAAATTAWLQAVVADTHVRAGEVVPALRRLL